MMNKRRGREDEEEKRSKGERRQAGRRRKGLDNEGKRTRRKDILQVNVAI
jgi:hypothetical protein